MAWTFVIAAGFLVLSLAVHIVSTGLCLRRFGRGTMERAVQSERPALSLIIPVRGLDPQDATTLRSGFDLEYPAFELIFCCADSRDPAVSAIRKLIAEHPRIDARLLIGDDRSTLNPKLNNLVKGWHAASHDWITIADCNVLLPPQFIDQLLSARRADCGLICSPPIGSFANNFGAAVECAFLNTYQARWQYAADGVGFGFAQGKVMLWHRPYLEAEGGIHALGKEIAEDAAATKVVRATGKCVRLVDRPVEQPLGLRSLRQVWDRQVRWARLRRATFPLFFIPEVATSSVLPLAAAILVADTLGASAIAAAAAVALVWYGCEALLAYRAKWQLDWSMPIAWLIRDLMLIPIWTVAWLSNEFTWRGNDMQVPGFGSSATRAPATTGS